MQGQKLRTKLLSPLLFCYGTFVKKDRVAITPTRSRTLETTVRNILDKSLKVTSDATVLVLYDTLTPMALLLLHAYQNNGISTAVRSLDLTLASKEGTNTNIFFTFSSPEVIEQIDQLKAGDLVVGIQSKPEIFKFTNYRLRTHLYTKDLKNVDHVYLSGEVLVHTSILIL